MEVAPSDGKGTRSTNIAQFVLPTTLPTSASVVFAVHFWPAICDDSGQFNVILLRIPVSQHSALLVALQGQYASNGELRAFVGKQVANSIPRYLLAVAKSHSPCLSIYIYICVWGVSLSLPPLIRVSQAIWTGNHKKTQSETTPPMASGPRTPKVRYEPKKGLKV